MLGYAIIGCGRIFRNHAVSIAQNPDARLVAVSDIKPGKCQAAIDQFGAQAYADYEEMLARPDIDAVSICLPHYLHYPAVMAAARHGKHILCEKPIAINREQAVEMIDACHDAGVKLGIVLQNRYNDATRKVLQAQQQGRFGRMVSGAMLQAVHKGQEYYSDDWHGRWATEGGGALLTQGIHTLDLLCFFLGRPLAVKAYFNTILHDIEVEDVGSISIRFENDAAAGVTITNCGHKEWWQRIDLLGTKGSVTIEDNRITHWEFADSRPEDAEVGNEETLETSIGSRGYGTGHPKIINDFISSITENRPFAVPGEEGLKVSEVIWAAYEASRSGKEEILRHYDLERERRLKEEAAR